MLLLLALTTLAPADRLTVVDGNVLSWADDRSEVALFGVNYYPPFSIDYYGLGQLGLDRRQVIEQDLDHLVRLGLQALRLHCWDREISDHDGNLLDNEHLALLDYLIAAAKRRGLYTVLTPIAWWGTGNESPGFSTIYDMLVMTTDPGAPRAAQRRYLAQFVTHRNRETGLTYAEDPAVLAFEMINEPRYPQGTTPQQVTEYADALLSAVRETGCKKPLFFSYFANQFAGVGASTADGITYGWYPTGLVNQIPLTYNALARVADFPNMRHPAVADKIKAVYEFDGADLLSSYIYPAMARTFRANGVQWACQFQYDAWPLAPSNANWQTHWLSLPYTPSKAVSFAIAAETFRQLPRGQAADGNTFGPTTVSYDEDRSELVSETIFAHSNSTATRPPKPAALEHLYGVGSSPVVQYDGTGAWFLDRVEPGAWRLEVFPDVVVLDNPFARPSLQREVARLVWRERAMALQLPDLSAYFEIEPLNEGNLDRPKLAGGRFAVRPGVYRLTKADGPRPAMDAAWFAPQPDPGLPLRAAHLVPDAFVAGSDQSIAVTVSDEAAAANLWYLDGQTWRQTALQPDGPYHRSGKLPAAALTSPAAHYAVSIGAGEQTRTWPDNLPGTPDQLGQPQPPTVVFDAATMQPNQVPEPHGVDSKLTLADGALRFTAAGFPTTGSTASGVRFGCGSAKVQQPVVLVRARATEAATNSFELGLVLDDGRAYGYDIPVGPEWSTIRLPAAQLKPLWATKGGQFEADKLHELSLVFGTWLYGAAADRPHGFELASVAIEPAVPGWAVPVEPVGPPVPLLRPAAAARQRMWKDGARVRTIAVPGDRIGFEFAHTGFGPPPDSMGVEWAVADTTPARLAAMQQCSKVRIEVRGGTPATTRAEFVLIENDDSAWGTEIDVSPTWQTIEVPLSTLRHFGHWRQVAGRGGEGDHCQAGQVSRVQFTIGAWLNPDHAAEPWRVQLAAVELVP